MILMYLYGDHFSVRKIVSFKILFREGPILWSGGIKGVLHEVFVRVCVHAPALSVWCLLVECYVTLVFLDLTSWNSEAQALININTSSCGSCDTSFVTLSELWNLSLTHSPSDLPSERISCWNLELLRWRLKTMDQHWGKKSIQYWRNWHKEKVVINSLNTKHQCYMNYTFKWAILYISDDLNIYFVFLKILIK